MRNTTWQQDINIENIYCYYPYYEYDIEYISPLDIKLSLGGVYTSSLMLKSCQYAKITLNDGKKQ